MIGTRVSTLTLCALVVVAVLPFTAWGEGVDIFPFGGGKGDGSGANLGGNPGSDLSLVAIHRRDNGDVWAQTGRWNEPGVVLESKDLDDFFEGEASDAGPFPVSFEIELVDPELRFVESPDGVRLSSAMELRDLHPDDLLDPVLEAGREGWGLAFIYLGRADPLGRDGKGRLSSMTHVYTMILPEPRLDLGDLRREALASLGWVDLDVGVLLVDGRRQQRWSTAIFALDSLEADFSIDARSRRFRR